MKNALLLIARHQAFLKSSKKYTENLYQYLHRYLAVFSRYSLGFDSQNKALPRTTALTPLNETSGERQPQSPLTSRMASSLRLESSVVLASLLVNVLALSLPLVMLQIFDRVVPNQAEATLAVLFVALVVALGMDVLLKICRITLLGHQTEKFEIELADHVTQRMLCADPFEFSKVPSGTHLDRFAGIAQLRDHYGGQGRLLSIDLPFAAIFVVMIGIIGGWLIAVPLVNLVCLAALSMALGRLQGPVLDARQSVDQRRYSFLMEVLGQIVTVKSQTTEQQMIRRYEVLQSQSEDASRDLIFVAGISQALGAVFGQVAVATMGGLGAFLIINGSIGPAELAACMLLNGRTVQPFLKILSVRVQLAGLAAAKARLGEIDGMSVRPAAPHVKHALIGEVEAQSISMVVGPEERELFSDVSFHLPPGSSLAIAGQDGGGRSSLMRAILGEQNVKSGQLLIDKQNPSATAHFQGRGGLVYVPQDPVIFDGTILENLSLFGGANACDRAVSAAETIGLDRQIFRLPLGYDTPVSGSASATLTLGFLQRMALARALALEPKILLLNEANSAVDAGANDQLLEALRDLKGQTTLICVTRRTEYLSMVDEVVDLRAGAVAGATLQDWDNDASLDRLTLAENMVSA